MKYDFCISYMVYYNNDDNSNNNNSNDNNNSNNNNNYNRINNYDNNNNNDNNEWWWFTQLVSATEPRKLSKASHEAFCANAETNFWDSIVARGVFEPIFVCNYC